MRRTMVALTIATLATGCVVGSSPDARRRAYALNAATVAAGAAAFLLLDRFATDCGEDPACSAPTDRGRAEFIGGGVAAFGVTGLLVNHFLGGSQVERAPVRIATPAPPPARIGAAAVRVGVAAR